MAQTKGNLGGYNATITGATVSQNQHVGNWDEKIYLLNPSETPFTLFMSKLAKKETDDARFNWFDDEYLAEYDTVSNDMSTAGTSATVAHREYFSDGDLIYVPSTGEVMKVNGAVTATGAGALTVERGIGNAGVGIALDGSGTAKDIFIIGNASAEFSDIPEAKVIGLTEDYNYAQIVKTVVPGISRTLEGTNLRTGDEEKRLKAKYGIEHAKKWEKLAFFGQRALDLTGTRPIWYTGGLVSKITSNVYLNCGALSEARWDHWVRDFLQNGSSKKVIFVSPLIASIVSNFSKGKLSTYVKDPNYGVAIKKYQNDNGEVALINHKHLLTGALGGMAIGVDLEYCKLRPMKNNNNKLYPQDMGNVAGKGWYYEGQVGFQFMKESTHALLTGVTGTSSSSSS